ncbi:MAG: alpha/beta fold hydrolase [Candidatus Accumulibacter meliphilus]|jgi:esterase/lipase superfamily enzyme|uniref:Alpha/beta fold hydrolase n=1 Tax=Candidatus Accumulibacter meliphilus TaxID=2211374 RepID=A0A369XFW4_9PROT|nr:MAG: alpha/beta fold hydrolase [Candidatus Accumulibacter meliphilus]
MTDRESRIEALSSDQAIALLRRFVRAIGRGVAAPALALPRADSLFKALSVSSDTVDRPLDGDLAKSALRVVASDERFSDALSSMLSQADKIQSFTRGATCLETADVMAVLETQLSPESNHTRAADDGSGEGRHTLVRGLARQLAAYVGFEQTGPQSDAEYRVWYATTRKPLNAKNAALGFGVERDDSVHYGNCRVFIPRSHKVGSLGSPWWKRLLTFTDDRLCMLAVETLNTESFWQQVGEQLTQCPADDRDAVVFIHGFNVDFQEAALRAAQIGFDLQIKGAMAFYSWASRGDVARYPADEAAIELDEDPIADFLCDFALRTSARRVHVIAHSMGNRAVLRAVHKIAQEVRQRVGVHFGQIILAAADVDSRKFLQLCSAYPKLAERTTMYVSTRDAAVEASRWLHDFPRAGLMPPVTVAPGIDTVNAVNTDLTLLGHGYVAQAREVVCDVHALINKGEAPERRFGLRAMSTDRGEPYWLIGA